MQELHVPIRYQKFTKLLQYYRNLEQLLMQPPNVTVRLLFN